MNRLVVIVAIVVVVGVYLSLEVVQFSKQQKAAIQGFHARAAAIIKGEER